MLHNLPYLTPSAIQTFIQHALSEDIGPGDFSTLSVTNHQPMAEGTCLAKDSGIVAGLTIALEIYKAIDPAVELEYFFTEGQPFYKGDVLFKVRGKASSLLQAERLVLNCIQRMSGIATYTYYMNSLLKGTNCKLLDTRKTTPNFRLCEKWAVAIGGGVNHRFGLYDMVMLKDNHVDMAGGIETAITSAQTYLKANNLNLGIEVETRTLTEVEEVCRVGGIQRIMFDNFSLADLREGVAMVAGKFETEASGGVTEHTIKGIAETGVDFISVGALTHSAKSKDISLKLRLL